MFDDPAGKEFDWRVCISQVSVKIHIWSYCCAVKYKEKPKNRLSPWGNDGNDNLYIYIYSFPESQEAPEGPLEVFEIPLWDLLAYIYLFPLIYFH